MKANNQQPAAEDPQFNLWWVSNPSNMLNMTPEQAERTRLIAKNAWEASRFALINEQVTRLDPEREEL